MWWIRRPSESVGLGCGIWTWTHHPPSGNTGLSSPWSPTQEIISVSIRTLTYLQRLTRCSWSNSPLPVRENVGHGQILTSFWRFQTPSLWVNSSWVVRHLGRIRHSKPHMLKRRLGLSLLYTETKLSSHRIEVTDRGSRFLMSQNTARPL